MNSFSKFCSLLFFILILAACKPDTPNKPSGKTGPKPTKVSIPKFDRDSAFAFVEKQLAFGPRVVNSEGHKACKNWLVKQFKSFGAEVIEQSFQAKAYTGTLLNGTNIIAQYNPEMSKRVILAAHWDSRHISDYDPTASNKDKPVPGADDGGSGVAVLLEIARQLGKTPIDLGVDIILFDAEDYGESQSEDINSWCLGSQHWSRNQHKPEYRAKYGILLDMVGAKNARFTKEEVSRSFAPQVLDKVWKMAKGMGYGNYFVDVETRLVIDDHLFVNREAKIPMIDIINRPSETETGFGHYWHTQKDDISVIDKRTLRSVGQLVLAVIYNESIGKF